MSGLEKSAITCVCAECQRSYVTASRTARYCSDCRSIVQQRQIQAAKRRQKTREAFAKARAAQS